MGFLGMMPYNWKPIGGIKKFVKYKLDFENLWGQKMGCGPFLTNILKNKFSTKSQGVKEITAKSSIAKFQSNEH